MAAFRPVSLLLALAASWSCVAFVGSLLRPRRRIPGLSGRQAELTNPDFFWGNGFEAKELEEAAGKLSQSTGTQLWDRATFPPEDRWSSSKF